MPARNEGVPDPGAEPTFEEALSRLETIVEELESGGLSLEDSIRRYEEGMRLSRRLNRTLDEAEKTIERLVENGGEDVRPLASPAPAPRPGKPRTRPMDLDVESRSGETELPF